MKLRIIKGPDVPALEEAGKALTEKKKPQLTFKVKPIHLHFDMPDINVKIGKIILEGDGENLRFKISGQSKEGDICKIVYRPLKHKKGRMQLSGG